MNPANAYDPAIVDRDTSVAVELAARTHTTDVAELSRRAA